MPDDTDHIKHASSHNLVGAHEFKFPLTASGVTVKISDHTEFSTPLFLILHVPGLNVSSDKL